ncbi:hypothetical protein HMPREF1586_01115, partial [Gardnerella vaginalis JCP8522]
CEERNTQTSRNTKQRRERALSRMHFGAQHTRVVFAKSAQIW